MASLNTPATHNNVLVQSPSLDPRRAGGNRGFRKKRSGHEGNVNRLGPGRHIPACVLETLKHRIKPSGSILQAPVHAKPLS